MSKNFELSLDGMLYPTTPEGEAWLKDADEVEAGLVLLGKPIKNPTPFAQQLAEVLRPVEPGVWWVIYWHDPREKPSYYFANTKKEVEAKLGDELKACARFIERAVAPFSGWIENECWVDKNGDIHKTFIHEEFPFVKKETQYNWGSMVKFTQL